MHCPIKNLNRLLLLNTLFTLKPLKRQSQQLSSALSSACDFKVISANSVDPDQTAPLAGSTLFAGMQKIGLKSLQEYSADKQTTFSDAVFLGALRVKVFDRNA